MKKVSKLFFVGLILGLLITTAVAEPGLAQDLLLQNQERIEDLEERVDQLEKDIDALQDRLDELGKFDQEEIESTLASFQELNDNYAELTSRVNQLEKDFKNMKQDGEGSSTESSKKLSDLAAQLKEISQQTDRLEERLNKTEQSLTDKVSALSDEIDALKKANSELTDEVSKLKEDNANLKERVSRLEETIATDSSKPDDQAEEAADEVPLPFYDPFEGEASNEWRIASVGQSTLGVEEGRLTIVGTLIEDQPLKAFVGNPSWQDYVLSVDVDYEWTHGTNHQVALFVRAKDRNNMVGFFMHPGGKAGFWVKENGVWGDMVSGQDISELKAYNVVISVEGDKYSATLNDQLVASMEHEGQKSGFVGLQSAVDSRTGDLYKVLFDNFRVEPIE